MSERRKFSKTERLKIFNKTHGHCAYCGIILDIRDMQVDHVNALRRGGEDNISNTLPACRSCNHYKSSMSLDGFRKMLENMPYTLMRDSVTYKNAVRYGLVKPNSHPVVFYFEQEAQENG